MTDTFKPVREGSIYVTCSNSKWIETLITNGSRAREAFLLTGAAIECLSKEGCAEVWAGFIPSLRAVTPATQVMARSRGERLLGGRGSGIRMLVMCIYNFISCRRRGEREERQTVSSAVSSPWTLISLSFEIQLFSDGVLKHDSSEADCKLKGIGSWSG